MHAADLLPHPTAPGLANVRAALRERLEESLRLLGPAALDRARIAEIFREVLHREGDADGPRRAG